MNSIGFVVVCFCFSTFGNELQIQATFRCHVGKFSLPKASCPSPEDHFPLLFHSFRYQVVSAFFSRIQTFKPFRGPPGSTQRQLEQEASLDLRARQRNFPHIATSGLSQKFREGFVDPLHLRPWQTGACPFTWPPS